MSPTVSRRHLAALLGAAIPGAAQPAAAQTSELDKALEAIDSNSKKLSSFKLLMATEPACIFKP
jgi:hypothetical protein